MTARSSFIDGDPDSKLERRDAVRSLNGPPPLALAARGSSLSEVWPSLRLKTQMVPQDPGRRSGGRASHGATRKRTVTGHFQLNLRLSATASAARPRPGPGPPCPTDLRIPKSCPSKLQRPLKFAVQSSSLPFKFAVQSSSLPFKFAVQSSSLPFKFAVQILPWESKP